MRLNGIGTMWLGASQPDAEGCVFATLWFTLFFVPLVPLRRAKLKRLPHRGSGFSVRELERTRLSLVELVKTWAFAAAAPVLALGPLVPAIEELRVALGLPKSWQLPWIAAGIVWFGVFVWRLASWHEARFRP